MEEKEKSVLLSETEEELIECLWDDKCDYHINHI